MPLSDEEKAAKKAAYEEAYTAGFASAQGKQAAGNRNPDAVAYDKAVPFQPGYDKDVHYVQPDGPYRPGFFDPTRRPAESGNLPGEPGSTAHAADNVPPMYQKLRDVEAPTAYKTLMDDLLSGQELTMREKEKYKQSLKNIQDEADFFDNIINKEWMDALAYTRTQKLVDPRYANVEEQLHRWKNEAQDMKAEFKQIEEEKIILALQESKLKEKRAYIDSYAHPMEDFQSRLKGDKGIKAFFFPQPKPQVGNMKAALWNYTREAAASTSMVSVFLYCIRYN